MNEWEKRAHEVFIALEPDEPWCDYLKRLAANEHRVRLLVTDLLFEIGRCRD